MDKLYTLQEAADILKIKRITLYRWIRDGKIKAVILPSSRLRVRESDLEVVINPYWPDSDDRKP